MSYQKWRDEFMVRIGAEGLDADTTRKVLRYAATLDRLAVAQCNGDYPADNGEREVEECPDCGSYWVRSSFVRGTCKDCRTEQLVRETLEGSGFSARFYGDPRGCVVTLLSPSGAEFGVPVRQR